ncbi:MAG: NosD domain-containing protein, partial [Thermoplasmata archaeon]
AAILEASGNSTVMHNTIANNPCGVDISESANCTVANNSLIENGCGIMAVSSPLANLTGNNISADEVPAEGIVTEGCSNGTISLNNISDYHMGISLLESDWMSVTDNHIHNTSYGVSIDTSTHVNASENTIETSPQAGVRLHSSSRCEVMNNEISGGGYGISTWFSGFPGSWHSSENNITGNRVTGTSVAGIFEVGMSLNSNNNNISMNEVYGNDGDGIYISGNDDVLYDNSISNNGGYGVLLHAQRATVIANTFVNDGLYLGPQSYLVMPIAYFNSHTITDDNTVNGKPLLYFKSQSDLAITGDSAGEVIIADCERVDISGLELSDTDIGIQVVYSEDVDIDNCTVTDTHHSIEVLRSEDCSLISNVVMDCTYGLSVRYGNDTVVSNNNLTGNAWSGLTLDKCQRSTISSNRVTANEEWGLCVWTSNQTVVTGNILNENGLGVTLAGSENATVFRNDFVNNTIQGDEVTCSNSYWNSTYPEGGNYWSDYEGEDQFSGPDQDIPGADGIGDTPYLVVDTHMDNYPLMCPTSPNLPPTAVIVVIPTTGTVGLSFSFDASDSYDVEDSASALEVRWDWDGDGAWDTDWSTEKVAYHQYDAPGEYSARLEVRDTGGLANTTSIEVMVIEVIPEFSSVLLPVLSLLLCMTLVAWRKRGAKRDNRV